MASVLSESTDLIIRPIQYRDLEAVESLLLEAAAEEEPAQPTLTLSRQLEQIRRWYAPLKLLNLFPHQLQYLFRVYVAVQGETIMGVIQVSPFNCTRSTWRIDQITVCPLARVQGVGTQLLRYCFETIWEARTWLLEVNVHNNNALGLYRQNGFQPLAQMTYWSLNPAQVAALASRQPDLPNLLPVSNADAAWLHQLDTATMPPLVRQVFDRHINDFKVNPLTSLLGILGQGLRPTEIARAYVFEPQRKAAIGYYQMHLCRKGDQPHQAELMVHPAYTWLYPELLAQMAHLTQSFPPVALHLTSADYQPEREACLEHLGAERIAHTLMMSRSVWHKIRESRSLSLEGLQLSEVLQGFQQNRSKPVPGRIALTSSLRSSLVRPPVVASVDHHDQTSC